MDRIYLDQKVAKAKSLGDKIWNNLRLYNSDRNVAEQSFATWCDNHYMPNCYPSMHTKLNNLLMIESFLRAGKHMDPAVKLANRKAADKLYDELLKEPD